jgi:hypothetical protein
MHQDLHQEQGDWLAYIQRLGDKGVFRGGSSIGQGLCARKTSEAPAPLSALTGFIRVEAESLTHAKQLLEGNPVYEGGAPLRSENCRAQTKLFPHGTLKLAKGALRE